MPPLAGGSNAVVWVDDHDVRAAFAALVQSVTYPGLAMFASTYVADHLRERADARFDAQGDEAVGGVWQELRKTTQAIRFHQGYAPAWPINVRTTELRDFVTKGELYPEPLGGQGVRMQFPGPASGELKKKLKTAQMGTKRGENPKFPGSATPPRPVAGLDERDLESVLIGLNLHVQQMVSERGLGVPAGGVLFAVS